MEQQPVQNKFDIDTLRHSASHIMADAVMNLFPGTKLTIGPSIEDGFYYDFDSPHTFVPEDLEKIEAEMKKITEGNHKFLRKEISRDEAKELFKDNKFKLELIDGIKDEAISIYQHGDFIDLCRGPHVDYSKRIKHFKLLSVAGAYWRGSEKREQLQRIYGTIFFAKEELLAYLAKLEEAKKRDHRKLGQQLDLFSIHDEVGSGLIHWHPKGATTRIIIEDFWKKEHVKNGYDIVITPHIANEHIYQISGHLQTYSEYIYSPMDIDGTPYRVKPMNCPNHIMIYKTKLHSYRELPLRLAELGPVYRYEKSGVLHGLLRVRGFTIDDAHIFCRQEQLQDEMLKVFNFSIKFLKAFGFNNFEIFLATKPEKFVGNEETWKIATEALRNALEKTGYKYTIDEGGGAFYGPKIDLKIKDVLGRTWQCSTIQFDFNLPERFDVTYRDETGKDDRVVMIHRALLGSIERFFGLLIEHYGGRFPLWLAPVQVAVASINDKQEAYADEIQNFLKDNDIRTTINKSNDTISYKVRDFTLQKIPYIVVVGDKEVENKTISVRTVPGENLNSLKPDEFLSRLKKEIEQKI